MRFRWIIIFVILFTLLIKSSCNFISTKEHVSKEFKEQFDQHNTKYKILKDFMLHNQDSINTIRIIENKYCEVTKLQLKDAFNNYILISIDDSLKINNKNTRTMLKQISRFMLEQNIAYVNIDNNKVLISYKFSSAPCFELIWENNSSDTDIGVVINFKIKESEFWKYYLDSNWYIQGVPCFN